MTSGAQVLGALAKHQARRHFLTAKQWKRLCPSTYRPAIRGTNSRSQACLLRSTYDSAPRATKKRLRGKFRHSQSGLSRSFLSRLDDRRQGNNDPRWAAQSSRPFCCPTRPEQQAKQPARARCWPALHTKGPEYDSAALSTPANTQETNTTNRNHHAAPNTRLRTVHRRKHRGNQADPFLISQISLNSNTTAGGWKTMTANPETLEKIVNTIRSEVPKYLSPEFVVHDVTAETGPGRTTRNTSTSGSSSKTTTPSWTHKSSCGSAPTWETSSNN